MKARMGAPKAITATAHTLARLLYTMLQHGTAYVRQGMDAYAQQYRERAVKNMTRRAKALGYILILSFRQACLTSLHGSVKADLACQRPTLDPP